MPVGKIINFEKGSSVNTSLFEEAQIIYKSTAEILNDLVSEEK